MTIVQVNIRLEPITWTLGVRRIVFRKNRSYQIVEPVTIDIHDADSVIIIWSADLMHHEVHRERVRRIEDPLPIRIYEDLLDSRALRIGGSATPEEIGQSVTIHIRKLSPVIVNIGLSGAISC